MTANQEIAAIIGQQMGGLRRLSMFVGAKNFVAIRNGLQFDIGKGATNKATRCQIVLAGDDTYTVAFYRFKADRVTMVQCGQASNGVYCDMLRATFEDKTGMYLSF